jgi:hypothetical protein
MSIIKSLLGIKEKEAVMLSQNRPQVRENKEIKTQVIVYNAVGQEVARYKGIKSLSSDRSGCQIEVEGYEGSLYFNSDCWVEVIDVEAKP